MKRIAVYPGSFDPFHNGHLNVLTRSLQLFDSIEIGVFSNTRKKGMWLFTLEERVKLIDKVLDEHFSYDDLARIKVRSIDSGLLVDWAVRNKTSEGLLAVIIRGLRSVSDFDYEFQMAETNHALDQGVETVFVMTRGEHFFISSSMIREVAMNGGNVSKFVEPLVKEALERKYKKLQGL